MLSMYEPLEIDYPVCVDVMFGFQPSKKNYPWPTQNYRGDLDNLLKGVFDGLVHNSHLVDDKFVVGTNSIKKFTDEDCVVIDIWKPTEK